MDDLTVYGRRQTYTLSDLPDWSRLKQDMENHPHVSMGYASALIDIDDDGQMDWFVGAPTAGSGQDGDFAEQAGWIGWFELRNREWILQSRMDWARTFDHFGWSRPCNNPNPNVPSWLEHLESSTVY